MSYHTRQEVWKELSNSLENVRGDCLDGADYDNGAVEDAKDTASNAARAVVKLVRALMLKGVLDRREAVDILYEYSTTEWDSHDPQIENSMEGR